MVMVDEGRVQEIKDRLADRYTAAELCDLLDIPVEDIVEEYWAKIMLNAKELFEQEFELEDDDDDLS